MINTYPDVKISPVLWLVIPVVFGIVHMTMQMTMNIDHLMQEGGPYELVQFIFIFSAFLISAGLMTQMSGSTAKWFIIWVGIIVAGSFYVAGEEVSWGQHFFHWTTPAEWEAVNDHEETNLHNTTQWLDQKPKSILEAGIYVGAIVIPLLIKFAPQFIPARFAIIYPASTLCVIALELIAFRGAKAVDKATHLIGFDRLSEVQELLVYYFILLYVIILFKRFKSAGGVE